MNQHLRIESDLSIKDNFDSDTESNISGSSLSQSYVDEKPLFSYKPSDSNNESISFSNSDNGLKIIKFPRVTTPPSKGPMFIALQEWEGCITYVDGTEFGAELVDLTYPDDNIIDTGVFDLCEVDESKKDRIFAGSIFRLLVGFEKRKGTRTNGYRFYFRRA